MEESNIHQNINTSAISELVFLSVVLVVVGTSVNMFAWCNPKKPINKLNNL
jgi:hypothetical protein